MRKNIEQLTVDQINDQQIIDLRDQRAFQNGHLKGSLNLNPKNLVRYGQDLLEDEKAIVFVLLKENEGKISSILKEANAAGIKNVRGYLLAEEIPTKKQETMQTIAPEDFVALTENYKLLDVRHPEEITRPAPKKNLVNLSIEDLTHHLDDFDSNQTIYTLCGSGNRSTSAASYLKQKGFKTAVIDGGMSALEPYTKEKK